MRLGLWATALLWGCIVSEGRIGRDGAPSPQDAGAPAMDAAPLDEGAEPRGTPCERCTALAVDAVAACLGDEAAFEACYEVADSCAGLCERTNTCDACALSADIVGAACEQSARADCDVIVEAARWACDPICAPPLDCGDCVQDAARLVAECHVMSGEGCGDRASEALARCDAECALAPLCVACFDEEVDCLSPACAVDVAVRMGDCVGVCLADCDGCESAASTTRQLCDAPDDRCGTLAELTGAACAAACGGDDCGACIADLERAHVLCGDTPDCAFLDVELQCGAVCDPVADACQACRGIAAEVLAECNDAEGCEPVARAAESACEQVCGFPNAACSSCALDLVEQARECVRVAPPGECVFDAGVLCPPCDDCAACVAGADLAYAGCVLEGGQEDCAEMLRGQADDCPCDGLPDCSSRLDVAERACIVAGLEGLCGDLLAIIAEQCIDG